MRWWHVEFHVSHEAAEAAAALLQEFPDVQGVQLEGIGALQVPHPEYGEWFDEMIVPTPSVSVSVYFPERYAREDIRTRVGDVIRRVAGAGLNVMDAATNISIESLDDTSWLNAWKEDYEPIPIGDELVIVPIWSQHDIPEHLRHRRPIILEPGMAFGTGTHQTTQLCTEALADLPLEDKLVLDVGTGSGVLAIAAARLGAERVTAIDIDPVAVRAAQENIETNDLSNVISVQEGNLLNGYAADVKFDVGIANILRDIVILLIPQIATRLNRGGAFISSGFIDTQAPAVEKALVENGFRIERRYQKDDWMALLAVKE